MKKIIYIIFIIIFSISIIEAKIKVKVKNLVDIEGLKENQLIGYGIVTGLNGTGDTKRFKLTGKLLKLVLDNIGIDVDTDEIYSKNSAIVLITAKLPPIARVGDKIDVEVSSLGDAKSIAGGVLLQAPLKAADGSIYAVAQGNISISDTENKNLTYGIIPNGAIVEKEINSQFIINNRIFLSLKYPDFETVSKIKESLLEKFKNIELLALNNKIIEITIPDEYKNNIDKFIDEIMNLEVEIEPKGKVVINRNTGVIVISGDVKLGESAVSYKNIDIYIKKTGVVQTGETEKKGSIFYIDESSDIKSLVDALNKIGAKTDDIIAILYSLKKSNALYGEIIIE